MKSITKKLKNRFNETKEWIKVGFITIGLVILAKFIALFFTQLLVFLG